MLRLPNTDPVAVALLESIHSGDVEGLRALLHEHPGLASARLTDAKGGSGVPLHAAADWPGY